MSETNRWMAETRDVEPVGDDQGDAALVQRALAGSDRAFATLIERRRPLVIALCLRYLGDRGAVDDAVQEATLQAWLGLATLREPARFGSWFAGIGLNCCRRFLRQQVRSGWGWDDVIGGRFAAGWDDRLSDPVAWFEESERRAQVHRAIASLPVGQRAAITRFYLDGLTHAEIATMLGISIGAVKTRLHKGRTALREVLGNSAVGRPDSLVRRNTMIDMRITDVRQQERANGQGAAYVVYLKDEADKYRLPIWIGEFEATAIALHLAGAATPRPMTYAFAAALLDAAGGRLSDIKIDRLVDDVFYATIVVEGAVGVRTVETRPSDALNLALLTDTPIRVESSVLEAVAAHPSREAREGADADSIGASEIVSRVQAEWERDLTRSLE